MKKVFRFTLCLLLMASLFCGFGFAAFADSSVTYEGDAEKFVFIPGSIFTDTDLFEGFKDVMPGDVLTQQIKVRNKLFTYGTVKIYMRAIPHDESNPLSPAVAESEDVVSMQDFLSQLYMEVYNKDELIYSASPDELDGLRNNVLLGTFGTNEGTTLTVKLYVPIELGNEYADRVGEVDWVFLAEEIPPPAGPVPIVPKTENPDEPEKVPLANPAQTGSYTPILLALCVISGFGIILLNLKKKQKD